MLQRFADEDMGSERSRRLPGAHRDGGRRQLRPPISRAYLVPAGLAPPKTAGGSGLPPPLAPGAGSSSSRWHGLFTSLCTVCPALGHARTPGPSQAAPHRPTSERSPLGSPHSAPWSWLVPWRQLQAPAPGPVLPRSASHHVDRLPAQRPVGLSAAYSGRARSAGSPVYLAPADMTLFGRSVLAG